jgi:hypothetical protein
MTSINRLDSVYGAPWGINVGFGTDLKIMVSPVRIRVPPLEKLLQIAEKCKSPDTTAEALCQQRVRKQGRSTAPEPPLDSQSRVGFDDMIYRLGGSDGKSTSTSWR